MTGIKQFSHSIHLILIAATISSCNQSNNNSHQTQSNMFTIDQIKDAHSKVKNGADFPSYVQNLVKLGVVRYETYVSDGHTIYFGKDGYKTTSVPSYSSLEVSNKSSKFQFQKDLQEHQQGKTDYKTFCNLSARAGIEKWIVDTKKMTCTYYDKSGDEMLVEAIPVPQGISTATITKTINIKASPEKVWNYVNDLSNWPHWAIHNVISSTQDKNGYWLMKGPRGVSKVKMNSIKTVGILDHDFIDPEEGHWKVPCRVVAGSEGAHFMITFTKPEEMPDEAFEMGMKMLDEELIQLKSIIEK